MTTKNCQVGNNSALPTGNCPETAQITLISSCIEQHLIETRTCQTHLTTLAELSRQNKLYCYCGKPIITAMYKYRTTVRNLNEENPWNNEK